MVAGLGRTRRLAHLLNGMNRCIQVLLRYLLFEQLLAVFGRDVLVWGRWQVLLVGHRSVLWDAWRDENAKDLFSRLDLLIWNLGLCLFDGHFISGG